MDASNLCGIGATNSGKGGGVDYINSYRRIHQTTGRSISAGGEEGEQGDNTTEGYRYEG